MSLTVPTHDELVLELVDELGEDSSDTEVKTRISRWLNETFEDILARRADWRFTRDQKEITLLPPYSTGTVSVTNGNTTVTGAGTTWDASWVNRVFWISGGGINYRVASVSGPNSLVLETAYQEVAATLQSYYLVQDRYPLDNQAVEAGISEVINPYGDDPLEEIDLRDLIAAYPKRRTFGDPKAYAIWGQSDPLASANPNSPMMYFDAFPTVARTFYYFYHKQYERITGTGKFPLPPKFCRPVLVAGVKDLSSQFNNEPRNSLQKYEVLIERMAQQNVVTGNRTRRMKETDIPNSGGLGPSLPSNYPKLVW